MMIEGVLSIIAEGVVVDKKTNNISFYNVIDEITLVQLPAGIPKMFFVTTFKRGASDPEEIDVELKFLSNGVETSQQKARVSFSGKNRARLVAELLATEIKAAGEFRIELHHAGKSIGGWTVIINQAIQNVVTAN